MNLKIGKYFSLIALTTCVIPDIANGQLACMRSLDTTLLDENRVMSAKYYYNQVHRWACSQNFESYSAFRARASQFGLTVPTMHGIFGLDAKDSLSTISFREKWEKWCKSNYTEILDRHNFASYTRTISNNLTEIIKACFKADGTHIYAIPTSKEFVSFTLKVERRDLAGGDLKVTGIEMSSLAGAICTRNDRPIVTSGAAKNFAQKLRNKALSFRNSNPELFRLWNRLKWNDPIILPITESNTRSIALTCYKFADARLVVTVNTEPAGATNSVTIPSRNETELSRLEARLSRLEARVQSRALFCTLDNSKNYCDSSKGFSTIARWDGHPGGTVSGWGLRNSVGAQQLFWVRMCCKFVDKNSGQIGSKLLAPLVSTP